MYLAVLGSVTAGALTGCVSDDDDDGPEFLVTDTAFSVQNRNDIAVQVTVENGFLERKERTLEVVVRYVPEEGEPSEWEQSESLELSGGTEILRHFRFEDIHDPDADLANYDIDAQLVDS